MSRRRQSRPRRRQPTSQALLYLLQHYRFWATLPADVTHVLLVGTGGDVRGRVDRPTLPKGVCRTCGCSEFDPCFGAEGPCGWQDRTETLCTACETP